jgi:hypothetical protein
MAVLMMNRLCLSIWQRLGSIHLTVVLCLLLTADLAYGYICLNGHTPLFAPLNEIGLPAWVATYGRRNPAHTIWFFILLGLLTLFCINTFVCTTDRVVWLIRQRRRLPRIYWLFKFAPHLMHYAVIIILCGYLGSYLFARVLDSRTLVPGTSLTLPGTAAVVTFDRLDARYHSGRRLPAFKDRVLKPHVHLTLSDGDHTQKAVLTCNRPVRFKGFGIFLHNFAPKQKGGMSMRTRVDLSIRRDPGVALYLAGIVLFVVGLTAYVMEWIFFKQREYGNGSQ